MDDNDPLKGIWDHINRPPPSASFLSLKPSTSLNGAWAGVTPLPSPMSPTAAPVQGSNWRFQSFNNTGVGAPAYATNPAAYQMNPDAYKTSPAAYNQTGSILPPTRSVSDDIRKQWGWGSALP